MVDKLLAGEPALCVVAITLGDTTTYDLVEMTDEQARTMADTLHTLVENKKIEHYEVSLFIDGVRQHAEYGPNLDEWVRRVKAGRRRASRARKKKLTRVLLNFLQPASLLHHAMRVNFPLSRLCPVKRMMRGLPVKCRVQSPPQHLRYCKGFEGTPRRTAPHGRARVARLRS
jgi:hypothetical protein